MATLRVILDTNMLLSARILDEMRRILSRLVQRHKLTSIEDNGFVYALIYKLKLLSHRSSGQPTGVFET